MPPTIPAVVLVGSALVMALLLASSLPGEPVRDKPVSLGGLTVVVTPDGWEIEREVSDEWWRRAWTTTREDVDRSIACYIDAAGCHSLRDIMGRRL